MDHAPRKRKNGTANAKPFASTTTGKTVTYVLVGLRGVEPLTSRLSGRGQIHAQRHLCERSNRCADASVSATGGVLSLRWRSWWTHVEQAPAVPAVDFPAEQGPAAACVSAAAGAGFGARMTGLASRLLRALVGACAGVLAMIAGANRPLRGWS